MAKSPPLNPRGLLSAGTGKELPSRRRGRRHRTGGGKPLPLQRTSNFTGHFEALLNNSGGAEVVQDDFGVAVASGLHGGRMDSGADFSGERACRHDLGGDGCRRALLDDHLLAAAETDVDLCVWP